ncbi:MAG: hypothetical protein WD226_13025 [Planctomycetota bacterium]
MLRKLLTLGFLIPLLDPTELSFAPAADATWTTSFDLETTLGGGELTVTMGGQDVPPMYLPKIEITSEETTRIATHETVEAAGDDGALILLRRFDVARRARSGELVQAGEVADSWNETEDSPLELRTVKFTRRAGESEFTAALGDDDETPIVTLTELSALLPGALLLPDEAVEVGDSWTLEGQRLVDLFDPAGDLGFPEREDEQGIERTTDGKLIAKLERLDAQGLATITLEGVLTQEWKREADLTQVPVTDGTGEEVNSYELEVAGTLLFDVEQGRSRSLDLEGTGTFTVRTVRDPDLPGATYESLMVMDATYRLAGETGTPVEATEAGSSK